MNGQTYSQEDLKRFGQAIAAMGSTADELANALLAFAAAYRDAYDALDLPDETHGMTLDELLGPEGQALIRANKLR